MQSKPNPIHDSAYVANTTVKLLLNGSGVGTLPQIQQEIARLFGFDYHKPPANFPYTKYLEIAEFLRLKFYADLPPEKAYEEMGYRAIQHYFVDSKVGSIVKVAARIMGPERGAKQFLYNMRATLTWGQHEFEEIRQGYARYRVKFVPGPPAMMRGVLKASLEVTGAKLVNIHTTILTEEDVIHEIEWS